jgi:hypothetical protein
MSVPAGLSPTSVFRGLARLFYPSISRTVEAASRIIPPTTMNFAMPGCTTCPGSTSAGSDEPSACASGGCASGGCSSAGGSGRRGILAGFFDLFKGLFGR